MSSDRLRDGQAFGRYEIVRRIGEGGMGAVYEAVHKGLKKRVAIKTLLPSIAENAEAKARFLREGEAASRINHPNVVDVTDVGTEDGVPYLVMEYFEGETLGSFLHRKGAVPVTQAVDLFLPIISAVSAGHAQGVIHRDLKPANVFLARGPFGDRVPKILDFGVSKLIGAEGAELTGTLSVLGTASYMSPEQAVGAKVVGAASDQYALGLILYEILTGARAYTGDSPLEVLHKIAMGEIVPPKKAKPGLPDELDAIVMKMLGQKPDDRHASLRAVGRAMLPLASERTRSLFHGAFDEGAPRPTSEMHVPSAQGGGTLVMPGAAEAPLAPAALAGTPGGTRLLDQPRAESAVDTTLGHGATETGSRPPPRRSSSARIAVGVAAVAAVVVVVALARGGGKPGATAPVSEPREPAAASAPELPHAPPPPAAVALPPSPSPAPAAPAAPRAAAPAERPTPPEAAPSSKHHHHLAADERDHGSHGGGHEAKKPTAAPSTTPAAAAAPNRRGANNAPIITE
jgi:serine/threonine-protein kinase